MITIHSLSVTLGDRQVLRDFSCAIERHRKAVIFGESGSGKSTLLKTLIGMYLPEQGEIFIGGMPLSPENLSSIRGMMYYLPQDIVPHGEETTEEYLRYPFSFAVNRGTPFPKNKLEKLLDALHLKKELLARPLYKLSGGERKRVGILLGLLLSRPLMLLDEPTAGVDTSNRDALTRLLFGQNSSTVIAVTHDESLISKSGVQVDLSPDAKES